ncbi:MAG: DUF1080 domain-containing protein [Acidobacteria bacterium]|nr:DUF1080 domain-containing protein [Acidobacteriota bacterium]
MTKITSILLLLLSAASARDNTLTEAERKAGWVLLFDGTTFRGWDDPALREPAGTCWKIEDGWLVAQPKPRIREDLATLREFRDFELVFEWRIDEGTNSGVKYRVQKSVFLDLSKMPQGMDSIQDQIAHELANHVSDRAHILPAARGKDYSIGFEFQIIDDARNADARIGDGKHSTGALYDMVGPTASPTRAAGSINTARIVVRGDQAEHWINGVLVFQGSLAAPVVQAALAARWTTAHPVYRLLTGPALKSGRIVITHHGDRAAYRNVKVRELR